MDKRTVPAAIDYWSMISSVFSAYIIECLQCLEN